MLIIKFKQNTIRYFFGIFFLLLCSPVSFICDELSERLRFDRISSRAETSNRVEYRIESPNVQVSERDYPQITFSPGDQVFIKAGGCVQTGGIGDTWKRYVDPLDDSDKYYGQIALPGINSGRLVPFRDIRGRAFTIPQFTGRSFLRLGYVDNNYGDNGYYDKDWGTRAQCRTEGSAYVNIVILRARNIFETKKILTIENRNPTYVKSSPLWANEQCGGREWLQNPNLPFNPRYGWTPVLDTNTEFDVRPVGMVGWAIYPHISNNDVPFLHPFGFDYNFFIAPDNEYRPFLAPSNLLNDPYGVYDDDNRDYRENTVRALRLLRNNLKVPGLMGVETDQGLVPAVFRANEGERVAVFGRWIIDCGHKDFHSEIHPPLLHITAKTKSTGETSAKLIARPFLVSQEFGDGALMEHLVKEIRDIVSFGSTQMVARPGILRAYSGTQKMTFHLSPATSRRLATDKLYVRYRFKGRSGVSVFFRSQPPDKVEVTVLMNDNQTRADLPPKSTLNIGIRDLSEYSTGAAAGFGIAATLAGVTNPFTAPFLTRGIETDFYNTSGYDTPRIFEDRIERNWIDVSTLSGQQASLEIDDSQPFPIFGMIEVKLQSVFNPNVR